MEAGYVLSQKGKKYVRAWYQVRQNCALYKFRAHEVRKVLLKSIISYLLYDTMTAGYQGLSLYTSSWLLCPVCKFEFNLKCRNRTSAIAVKLDEVARTMNGHYHDIDTLTVWIITPH